MERRCFMISKQIAEDLWYIGAVDEKLRVFGDISFTDTGAMYNSYLMSAEGEYVLLGALPERYLEEWLDQIKGIVGSGKLGWAVFFGTKDDGTAAAELLKEFPELVLIGTPGMLYRVEGYTEAHFRKIDVQCSRQITFGKKTLYFQVLEERYETPSVYVVDPDKKILYTADVFGSNYAAPQILVSCLPDREAYFDGAKHYLMDLRGKSRTKTLEAASVLVRENGIRMICPARGPVADRELERLLNLVAVRKEKEKKKKPFLAVIYAPGDYMEEIAACIRAGAEETADVEVKLFDLSAVSRDEILEKVPECDAYLLGTPQVRGDAAKAVWDVATSLDREDCEGKLAAVFTTGAPSGNAAENLRSRLAMLGCDLTLTDYLLQGRPDRQTLKNAYEYGFNVRCRILKIPNPRKPTLVKCLVCGEIFDASLGVCPACGVGLEQCVPVDTEEVAFQNDSDDRYVILGGGIAAVSAAEAIRSRDKTGRILLYSAERELPINRPMLTKDLDAASERSETLFVHEKEWYDEKKIELHLGQKVTALDVKEKVVATDDGENVSYDKLIYAMGAECMVPPFEGKDKEGVVTIRHLEDCVRLKELMARAEHAVVIGGGVLGLEAANELMRAGLSVTVLEASPQIIGRQVDADTAALIKKRMHAMHVACEEGVSIAGIEGAERVTGVRLADGRIFPAELVVISCGNRGNVQVAKAAGLVVERSIVVNEHMETSVPDIYACGDCAQFDGVNYQLWQEASGQGQTAGANAAGEPVAYANQTLGLSLEGFGTSLFAIGDAGKKENVPYRTVEVLDHVTNRHEKYWFTGGLLQGAVLVGAPEKTGSITQAVSVHAEYGEIF